MELFAALVLGSIDPLVVPLAVLQAGQGHFLRLAHPRQPEASVRLQLQAEATLPNAVAGLVLGFCLLLLCGFLSNSPTPTFWVFLLTIAIAIFSEMPFNPTATHKVFSSSFFVPITMLFIATSRTTVWRHDNLVEALLVGGDAGQCRDSPGTSLQSLGPQPV